MPGLCSLGLVVVRARWLHLFLQLLFMDSKSDGRHFFRVCFWLCFSRFVDAWAVLSGSRCGEGNVVTLVFTWLVTIVFYGFHR